MFKLKYTSEHFVLNDIPVAYYILNAKTFIKEEKNDVGQIRAIFGMIFLVFCVLEQNFLIFNLLKITITLNMVIPQKNSAQKDKKFFF